MTLVEALKVFQGHGIPTIVWLTPILPFINDTRENIEGILDNCIQAKVKGIICIYNAMKMQRKILRCILRSIMIR